MEIQYNAIRNEEDELYREGRSQKDLKASKQRKNRIKIDVRA